MKRRLSPYNVGSLILTVMLLIVVASVLFMNNLSRSLAEEEQKNMMHWAEATQQLILADEDEDISFVSSVIEGNTTIPVYMLDAEGNILLTRNVNKPVKNPTMLNGPIEIHISDDIVQYIYYEESTLLRRLRFFPYIEFGIIFLFVLIAVVTLYTAQHSEQDRVWVGLCKETAHQLGTPISALVAWQELLVARYPDDRLLPQMEQDIQRLRTIAERFSKIGSEPELTDTELVGLVREMAEYMRTRTSGKVVIEFVTGIDRLTFPLCAPLFSWVIENLMKNAVDAMDGVGKITLSLGREGGSVFLDVTDTGRGIDRKLYRTIFRPGYTGKQRGWGLGLSLSKRIIEDYHGGKIFVKASEPHVATTFRITMEESKNG